MTSATTLLPGPDLGSDAASECGPVAVARSAVSKALGSGQWCRSDRDLVDDVAETLALRAQVEALLLAQVAEVDSRGLAARRGCPSTRGWLRSAHRIAPGEASSLVKTALALRDDLPAVGVALAAGGVSLAQAQVCVTAIADLPVDTPVACRPQAEATMIEAAQSFDPVLLARIGRRLAEIVDPDGVQARDEKPDRDREDDAHRGRDLSLTPSTTGAGGTLRARLDAIGYATMTAYLNAATAPRVLPTTDGDPAAAGHRAPAAGIGAEAAATGTGRLDAAGIPVEAAAAFSFGPAPGTPTAAGDTPAGSGNAATTP